MEDKLLEGLAQTCNPDIFDQNTKISLDYDTDNSLENRAENCNHDSAGQNYKIPLYDDAAQTDGSFVQMDAFDVRNGTMETCSYEEQTHPILLKIAELSNKVQNLKKEHTILHEDVKAIAANSFPGSEIFAALQNLSAEYESLKKNYHEQCKSLTEKCENLKRKYLEESLERKRLYNEVIELKGNIRVFCRCRPLNQDEIVKGSASTVNLDASNENELQIVCSDSSKKQFKFDHVFGPEKNQDAVFLQTLPIVTSVLDGYNVCIFAYGQTGTGKTFTMEGTPECRGVNYRTLEELFRISEDRSTVMRYELLVSMLEVYNERIRDLLADNSNQSSKKLEIKQGADGTQEVPGLTEARVYGTDEVWELLKTGSRARSVGCTSANELSSRSHCLLRVTVKGESLINGQKTRSHLWLVDLAGSERVGRIEVEGERLKESQFINKSLSALGDVIAALASKTAHIPYRNSKLTHMLQSSLGGDCKTLMFVQISPSATDLGETLCSLNFASRVRGIEHGPARKQADITELYKYKQLAEKAKHDEKETKKLQDILQSLQLRLGAREHVCRSLQEKVRDLENQLEEERRTRLKQENRALAAVTSQAAPPAMSSFNNQLQKRPPLVPSKLRMPLRKITNFCPQPTPIPPSKTRFSASFVPVSRNEKENALNLISSSSKPKKIIQARRGSIAVRPTTNQTVHQPRRRASVAVIPSESTSSFRMSRNSLVSDSKRVWRMSRVLSPNRAMSSVMSTPAAATRSSKFMGSPPAQMTGSWKPKNPTVIALQKKQLVWSPLKMYRNSRRSFTPMLPN